MELLRIPQASEEWASTAQRFVARLTHQSGADRKTKQKNVLHPTPSADRHQHRDQHITEILESGGQEKIFRPRVTRRVFLLDPNHGS